MRINYTQRGFGRIDFQDANEHECSIQESSAATEAKLWLGINNVEVIDYAGTPRVIDLSELGTRVQALGRMHLTQDLVRDMLPLLHCFAETGELKTSHVEGSEDATAHPQWAQWLSWYGQNYTVHVPMRNNYPDNLEQALSWETWKAARAEIKHEVESSDTDDTRSVPDLNREWKFSKGCDCGCNDPSFTRPLQALRFLMNRMNGAGVAGLVGQQYAWDIMQILKRVNAVDSGEMIEWTTFEVKRPKHTQPFIYRIPGAVNGEIGLGYYMEEDATEWSDTTQYITYEALNSLTVNQVKG